jgi:hypothetical protein
MNKITGISEGITGTVTYMMPVINQVPYWEIESIWAEVAPMIQKAIDRQDEWTLDGVKQALIVANGTTQLWMVGKTGAVVTMIQTFQTGVRKCLLFMGGGSNLENSLHTHAEIETWAKKYFGCHKMIIHGRKGWLKVLDGYEEVTTCMEKKL